MRLLELIKQLTYKKWNFIVKIAIALTLLSLIIYKDGNRLREIDLSESLSLIRNIPLTTFFFFLLFGLIAISVMSFYDFFILKKLQYEIKPLKFFSISFLTNTFNNLLGVGGQFRAAIRFFLFKNIPIKTSELLYYNLSVVAAALTGLSTFCIILLFKTELIFPLTSHYIWLFAGIVLFSLYLLFYFFMDKLLFRLKGPDHIPSIQEAIQLKLKLFLVSVLEWSLAGLLFYCITQSFGESSFWVTLGIFAIAMVGGIMSFLAGGIIVFDLIAILGLMDSGFAASNALAAVLFYRVCYYIVPSALGTLGLLINLNWDKHETLIALRKYFSINVVGFLGNGYKVFKRLKHVTLAILVFLGGSILLLSSFSPGSKERLAFTYQVFSEPLMTFAYQLTIVLGFILLILSREVLYQVKTSWQLSVNLLVAGSVFLIPRSFSYEEALLLLLLAALVKYSKPEFYRESIPFKPINIIFNLVLGLGFIITFLHFGYDLSNFFFENYSINQNLTYQSFLQSGSTIYLLFILYLTLHYFRQEKIEKSELFVPPDLKRLDAFLENYSGHNLTHLLYLKDKYFFWSEDDKVLIPFSKYRDTIVVLGDPIGDEEELGNGIQQFQAAIDRYGYQCVFYQISDKNFSLYHDNGYYFFKLGEEAVVNLETFTLSGSWARSFRNTLSRFKREGYVFEVFDGPLDQDLLDKLNEVSDEWLDHRKEKGFSLGWFDEDYLQAGPIAVLTNSHTEEVTAFISFMPGYDDHQSISMDLIRFRKHALNSTMEYLILSSLVYFQEQGYKKFNLGMAPLAEVGQAPNSHAQEKMARLVYDYGTYFYSFDGLRRYKQKFMPDWHPKYLAYPKLTALPTVLTNISFLVSTSKKKTNKKKRCSL